MRIQALIPKPIGEALTQATIGLKEYGNVRIDDKIISIGMSKFSACRTSIPPDFKQFQMNVALCLQVLH